MQSEIHQALSALLYLDPSCSRENWVKIGMAAKAAGLSFEVFHSWSQVGANYAGERDCRCTWDSFSALGKITEKTLFSQARAIGWRNHAAALEVANGRATSTAIIANRTETNPDEDNNKAQKIWGMCEPATPQHDYIVRKQGIPDGLKVYPANGSLTIKGQAMAGALVVPCLAPDGQLLTLQFISKNGTKLNLPGNAFENGYFLLGDVTISGPIFIVEGIGQAWAAWKSTCCPAAVCFGASRMLAVARALRQQYPTTRLIVLPDRGKEPHAETVARVVAGEWCELPQEMQQNGDANDYILSHGEAALAEILSKAKTPPRTGARFRLLGRDDLYALPPLQWRIHGVLPSMGLAAIFGPSTVGKSFLGFDMGIAIAAGCTWFGYQVEAAPVVYVALEGEMGFRMRVAAWETHYQRKLPEQFHMVLQPFKLTDSDDIRDFASSVPNGAVVIIDTLNRAAPTADENSSRDMGEILEATKRLQALTHGLIVLVHHTGKDSARGMRGHSSLFAALDAAIEVTRDGQKREWRIAKSKDGQEGKGYAFQLAEEALGIDDYGVPYKSCVIKPHAGLNKLPWTRGPQGRNQKMVFDAIRDAINQHGTIDKPGVPGCTPSIELDDASKIASAALPVASDRKTERAKEAIKRLINQGVLGSTDRWIWIVS